MEVSITATITAIMKIAVGITWEVIMIREVALTLEVALTRVGAAVSETVLGACLADACEAYLLQHGGALGKLPIRSRY